MKKNVYIPKIAKELNLTNKCVEAVTDAFVNELMSTLLESSKASITNFGTFRVCKTKPYAYFSPIDGSKMETTGITRVSFSMSKSFQKEINKKRG